MLTYSLIKAVLINSGEIDSSCATSTAFVKLWKGSWGGPPHKLACFISSSLLVLLVHDFLEVQYYRGQHRTTTQEQTDRLGCRNIYICLHQSRERWKSSTLDTRMSVAWPDTTCEANQNGALHDKIWPGRRKYSGRGVSRSDKKTLPAVQEHVHCKLKKYQVLLRVTWILLTSSVDNSRC
jgi:hypothetical protein